MASTRRQHGTLVTNPTSGAERIAAIRQVVTDKQYAKIDGCMMDLWSASAIVAVYDKLSPLNQEKYHNLPAPRMAQIAFQLLK